MGTRSINALVVAAGVQLSLEANVALRVCAHLVVGEDGARLWTWETNISPFHARTGTRDLREELAIFEGVSRTRRDGWRWIRAGEDGGERGELEQHPLMHHEEWQHVARALAEQLDPAAAQTAGAAPDAPDAPDAREVVRVLYDALDSASPIVDAPGEDERYTYQRQLEMGAAFLGIARD